jgi:hypothetical protein
MKNKEIPALFRPGSTLPRAPPALRVPGRGQQIFIACLSAADSCRNAAISGR